MMLFGSLDTAPFLGWYRNGSSTLPGFPGLKSVKLLSFCVSLSDCSAETLQSFVYPTQGSVGMGSQGNLLIHGLQTSVEEGWFPLGGLHNHSLRPLAGGEGSFGSTPLPDGPLPHSAFLHYSWVEPST